MYMSFDDVSFSDKPIFILAGISAEIKKLYVIVLLEKKYSYYLLHLNSYTTLITLEHNIVRCDGYLRYNSKNATERKLR